MAFACQLQMTVPEAVPPEDFTLQFTGSKPKFLVTLQDFTDPTSNLEILSKKPKLLKDLNHQMKHHQQDYLQRE